MEYVFLLQGKVKINIGVVDVDFDKRNDVINLFEVYHKISLAQNETVSEEKVFELRGKQDASLGYSIQAYCLPNWSGPR